MTVTYTATDQPDGRIRVGSHHFIGGNIYNADGTGQSIVKSAMVGSRILFRIQVQNDGNAPDMFTFHSTGSAAPGYTIRYYWKSTEITAAMVAGTFTTPQVPQGYRYTIEAWVKVTCNRGPECIALGHDHLGRRQLEARRGAVRGRPLELDRALCQYRRASAALTRA